MNKMIADGKLISSHDYNTNDTIIQFQLQMFHGKKYNLAYNDAEYPVSVELGQSLYFEASVSGAEDLQIMTKRCMTTEGSDPMASPNYIFVDDG